MTTTKITDSSQIAEIGYSPNTQILTVQFKRKGVWYAYADVPAHIHDEFTKAKSKGKFFHKNIRGAYEYRRIHEEI